MILNLRGNEKMKWTSIRIKTISDAEDIIISSLYDIGLEGAQIEDKIPLTPLEKEQMFVDIMPIGPEDDGIAYLTFFVERDDNDSDDVYKEKIDSIIEEVQAELESLKDFMDIGEGTITISETEDLDWINNWKEFFHQFYVDDLLVIPSWEEVKPEDKDKKILHIDPGTAFGTGMHETTQLCIRQLWKYLSNESRILDVGTGSGILGIVSLMYGANEVVATDLDPCAVPAVSDNLRNNGIDEDKFKLIIGNIIDNKEVQDEVGYGCYDIVVANILADVLVPLTPVIINQMKPGAIYITSGIINDKEETVKKAVLDAGLELEEITYQGEWVSITARKGK